MKMYTTHFTSIICSTQLILHALLYHYFYYTCSAACNTLLATLTDNSLSLFAFKRHLKTFLLKSG